MTQSAIDKRLEKAYILIYKSLTESQDEAETCLDDSELNGYFKGIMNARILLALISLYKGDIDLARERITIIEEELNASHAVADDSLMRLSHARAVYFLYSRVYKDSFNSFVKCSNIAARLGDDLFQVFSANGKGVIKLDQMEYKDARDYFRVARSYLQGRDLPLLDNVLNLNIGCALNGLELYDQSFEALDLALNQARELGTQAIECFILDEIGSMLLKQKKFDEARKYLEEGLEKSRQQLFKDAHIEIVYNYATLLMETGEYSKAEKLIQDLEDSGEIEQESIVYHQVSAEIFEQKGDYKRALASCKEIHKINEKLRSTEVLHSVFKQEKREILEQNHRLQLVSTIGQELVSTLDLGQILNLIYAQMNVLMPVDLLSIATVSDNKINVEFTLNKGERIEPFTIHKENYDSIIAWCVRNEKEAFVRSIQEDASNYVRTITPVKGNDKNLLESVICIPLIHSGRLEGVLTVQAFEANSYGSDDLNNLRALASYVAISIRNAMQTEKMNELNRTLKHQSSVDSLTGLLNRREFLRQSRNVLRVCRRNHFFISLVMIDLDHFKNVNDNYGHLAGDEVLTAFGELLSKYFKRPLDCVGRYGGEELIVLAGDLGPEEAAIRMELLREDFSSMDFKSEQDVFKVEFSCGIYGEQPVTDGDDHVNKILSLADKYLYRAKESGRNCSFLSDHPDKPAKKFIFTKSEK